MGDRIDVSFKVPFAFNAGDTKMPAGAYHLTSGTGPETLLLRSVKGKHEVILQYTSVTSPKPVKSVDVTFNKYGTTDYLNSVAFGSISNTQGSWILKINPSAGEQAAAKAASPAPHTVTDTGTPK